VQVKNVMTRTQLNFSIIAPTLNIYLLSKPYMEPSFQYIISMHVLYTVQLLNDILKVKEILQLQSYLTHHFYHTYQCVEFI